MRPFSHRDPGIVGAALVRPDVVLQAIVDGVHLDPDIVRLLWRVGAGRLALVTDAMAGAGLGDGEYALGDIEIVVADDVVRAGDGVLAGSALTMIEAVRNLVAARRAARAGARGRVGGSCPGARRARARSPRARQPAPTSSCSTTARGRPRDRRRRDACRRLSPA